MLPIAVFLPDGRPLAAAARAAQNSFERLQGWLGRESLNEEDGLLICPCNSIHTFGMKLSIDVLFLDRQGRILALRPSVRPQRLVWGTLQGLFFPWQVQALELAEGRIAAAGLQAGQTLRFDVRGQA